MERIKIDVVSYFTMIGYLPSCRRSALEADSTFFACGENENFGQFFFLFGNSNSIWKGVFNFSQRISWVWVVSELQRCPVKVSKWPLMRRHISRQSHKEWKKSRAFRSQFNGRADLISVTCEKNLLTDIPHTRTHNRTSKWIQCNDRWQCGSHSPEKEWKID